jgi:DNA-binding MarR family transcriptional regulator
VEEIGRVTDVLLAVLKALLYEPDDLRHGFAIARKTGKKPQSVYPILDRLERSRWVEASWETSATEGRPNKRVYSLTADGRTKAVALLEARGVLLPRRPSVSPHNTAGRPLPGAI